jgi:(p)ppGpp synthase/HD superfamily hydrolase
MSLTKYEKLCITLKSYLKGKGYHKALEAYDFAKSYHEHMKQNKDTGEFHIDKSKINTRKDGITPEFQHQIEIALFITTLKEVEFEEDTIIAALLHDVREDYNVPDKIVREKFGDRVADAVEKLTKEFNGIKKDPILYFAKIAMCPIASLVKGVDRINNVSSMVGVFTIKKQEEYLFEVQEYFIPMLKQARNQFPQQLMSYHSILVFLRNMSKTIEAVLKAEKQLLNINTVLDNRSKTTHSGQKP